MKSIVNERLLTSHGEEKKRVEHLKGVEKRRIGTEEVIKKLEAELQQAQQQKNHEVMSKLYAFSSCCFLRHYLLEACCIN